MMDIQKWLDEIVQPGSPSKLANGGPRKPLPHSIPVKRDDRRHRRKLSISDSSLLDPLTQQEEKPSRRQKSHRKERADESIKSYTSQDTRRESTESLASSHRYLRKPRHKTRPERYDPSAKVTRQREAHSGPKQKREAKMPRRKSKRKKHDSGIMQSFHAENVSGARLTLKPREQLGIFNKGKTSTATRGRGCMQPSIPIEHFLPGADLLVVPDLVFSEMKFLQKQRDEKQPESHPQVQSTSKRRKRDRSHSKNEEISTFFASRQLVPPEKSTNKVPKKIRKKENTVTNSKQLEREQLPRPQINMLSDKQSSMKASSKHQLHGGTSYVSWSESSRAPHLPPVHCRTKHRVHSSQLDSHNGCKGNISTDERTTSRKPSTPPVPIEKNIGTLELPTLPSVTPSQRRISRSQSCPQRCSSPRRLNLDNSHNEAIKPRNTKPRPSPASLPACIPAQSNHIAKQVQIASSFGRSEPEGAPLLDNSNLSNHRHATLDKELEHPSVDRSNSSDLWRVVQQCNTALQERRQPGEQCSRINSTIRLEDHELGNSNESVPTLRGLSRLRSAENEKCPSALPNFAGPGIYEEQAQRSQLPLEPLSTEQIINGHYVDELEHVCVVDGLDYVDQGWDESHWNSIPEESRRRIETFDLEDGYSGEPTSLQLAPPGFWRPNRLY